MTEMEEEDIEEMADNSKKREKFVDDVKKSLVKTLEVCLTPKEVAKIQREFEKNVEYQETLATNSSGGSYDVPTVISINKRGCPSVRPSVRLYFRKIFCLNQYK